MFDKEKVNKFKSTNEYGINMYYIKHNGIDYPVIWYEFDGYAYLVNLNNDKDTFYNTYGQQFRDMDRSTFDYIFEKRIKKRKITWI